MKSEIIMTAFAILILFIICIVTPGLDLFPERGSVTGTFVEYKLHPMGEFCGDYAWTMVRLTDYEFDGHEMWQNGGRFYFDEYDTSVKNLKEGVNYTLYYHKSSRPSDTTSGDSITLYILDRVVKE